MKDPKTTNVLVVKMHFKMLKYKKKLVFGFITIAAIMLCARNFYVLGFEKIVPLFNQHDHFVLDFEYFYEMGMRTVTCPAKLYSDPGKEGTPVLLLNRNVFHPYPPPAALFFRLFSLIPLKYAYTIWSLCIYVLILSALLIFTKDLEKESHSSKSPAMWFPFLLCISAAPTFLDASFGNVNSLVMLLCVVYIWFFNCRKSISAGIILSVAFWLKLYPALLILTLIKTDKKASLIGGFFSGVILIFIISLFFIPIQVFKEFFFEIVPAYSGQTITHVFNQSLLPAILRIISSTKTFFSYDYTLIPAPIRIVTYILILLLLSVYCFFNLKYRISSTIFIAGLCNFIPLITPIGWGYTFTMLYPSFIILYYQGIMKKKIQLLLYVLCWCGLATPSYNRIEQYNIPDLIKLIYYSRYTITAIMITILLFQSVTGNKAVKEKAVFETVNEENKKLNNPPVLQT
jgi:hypothetical protein